MLCFVPDGERLVKDDHDLLFYFDNQLTLDRRNKLLSILERFRGGEEIALINFRSQDVYTAKVKYVIIDDRSALDQCHRMRLYDIHIAGQYGRSSTPSLVFESDMDTLLGSLLKTTKVRRHTRDEKWTKKRKIHGYGMRGLRRSNQEAAEERYLDWLEKLRKNPPKLED